MNRRRVVDLAKKMNVDIQITHRRGYLDIDMWAPRYHIFADSGCHCSVANIDHRFDKNVPLAEGWKDAYTRLMEGLEPCSCEECTAVSGNVPVPSLRGCERLGGSLLPDLLYCPESPAG